MSADEGAGWVAVVGWTEMTHSDTTRARGPLRWVKSHASLLDDAGYSELTAHQRGVFHGIVLAYALGACQLPAATSLLSRKLNARVSVRELEALSHAGLIRICARIEHVSRWHDASARDVREEVEREINLKAVIEGPDEGAKTDDGGAGPEERPEDLEQAPELPAATVDRMRARIGREIPF